MNELGTLRQLESWAQEELGARGALLALLHRHERALRANDMDELEATGEQLQAHICAAEPRGVRRRQLIDRLARHWAVDGATLSLREVASRFQVEGLRLARLRDDLEPVAREAHALARRVGHISRQQQAVTRDILDALVGERGSAETASDAGRLLDSRA